MEMKPNKYAILYPILFFLVTSMFVRSWVPALRSSWGLSFVACVLSVFVVPKFLRTYWFVIIAIYSAIIFVNQLMGDQFFDSATVANEIANLFMFSAFCYYCYNSNDKKCIYVLLFAMFVLVGIASIGSFIVNQVVPGIVRYQADFVEAGNGDMIFAYYRMGLSNYLLPHGLPAIIAPLVLIIKRTKRKTWLRLVAILFLAFTLLLVYLGGSTTVLLLSLIALSTFFISEKGNKQKNSNVVIVLTILFLPFILFPEVLTDIIGMFSGETAEVYAMHFQDMADYSLSSITGNTSLRMELYNKSFYEFNQNPLFGTNNNVPHHSVLLDRLGVLGLVGFIPFIGIIVAFRQFVSTYLDEVEKTFLNVTVIIMVSMLLIKGIVDKEIWLMFFAVAPLLLYVSHQLKYNK